MKREQAFFVNHIIHLESFGKQLFYSPHKLR